MVKNPDIDIVTNDKIALMPQKKLCSGTRTNDQENRPKAPAFTQIPPRVSLECPHRQDCRQGRVHKWRTPIVLDAAIVAIPNADIAVSSEIEPVLSRLVRATSKLFLS